MQQLTCLFAAPLMLSGSLLADDALPLLNDVHAAYAALGSVEVTERLIAVSPSRDAERTVISTTIDDAGHIRWEWGDLTVHFIDETLYLADRSQSTSYAITDAHDLSLHTAMARELPDYLATPIVTFVGSDDPEVWINALTMGQIEDPVATLLGPAAAHGTLVDQIALTGEGGAFTLSVDSETGLMTSLDGAFDHDGDTIKVSFEFSVRDVKEMPPIAFDPEDRVAVASFRKLFQKPGQLGSPVRPGSAPPDFTLEQLDGESVTLSDLKGRTVVLNFWSTWCKPATEGLELIDGLARWVKKASLDVDVLTINIWEGGHDDAHRRLKAANWMTSSGWTLPVLMSHKAKDDPESLLSRWKIWGIPLTVVIDPEGEVTTVQSGLSPSVVAELKDALAEVATTSS